MSWTTCWAPRGDRRGRDRGHDDDEYDAVSHDRGVACALWHGEGRRDAARVLARVHPTSGTPVRATVTSVLVAAAFAVFGDFTVIAAVTDFAVYVVFLAVNATVIILRRTRPDLPRPFAVPGTIGGVPIVPILGLASVGLMMSQLEPLAIAVGAALCAVGLVASWLARTTR